MFDAIGCIVAGKHFFFNLKFLMIVLVYLFFDNCFGLFLVCYQLCFVGLYDF